MPVIGSSSITPDFNAVGPSGPSGATVAGPIGNTGATGNTGPTGATGVHVVSTSKEFPYLNLNLSDGSVVQIKGVGGITGATGTVNGVNLGDGITIFSTVGNGVTGATMWFRGITSDGSISVYLSQDSKTIAISGDAIKQGGTAGTLATDKFLYLSDGGTASASGLTFESGGMMSFDNTVTLDPEENIIFVAEIESTDIVGITGGEYISGGETAGDGTGIQLEIRNGSVYKISTPIGIAGFTGEFNSNEVFSFTTVIESNNIWDWPTNVYFDEDDAFFSCAEDIINFISNDGGATWNASFTVRGYGVSHGDCDGIINIGSCCFIDDQGDNQCIEYTTKDICEEKNMAVWSMLSDCSGNCGLTAEGICCSDGGNWGSYIGTGVCIEGKGLAECNYFGGSFWEYLYYKDAETDDGAWYLEELETPTPIDCYIMEDLCASPCEEEWVACCVDGVCVGDSVGSTELGSVSSNICKYVLGGVPVEGGICGTVDCCDHSVVVGACCIEGIEQCQDVTNQMCSSLGGIFMGPGTDCETDVCCYHIETGICCLNAAQCNCCDSPSVPQNNCCRDLTFSECDYLGGTWHASSGGGGSCTPEVGSCQCGKSDICVSTGACCTNGICSEVYESGCVGDFQGSGTSCDATTCLGCCCTCDGGEQVLNNSTLEDCTASGGTYINTACDDVPPETSCCAAAGCTDDSDCLFNGLQFCCEDGVCEVCPGELCANDNDCPDGSCCCDGVCGDLKESGIPGQCVACNGGGSCPGACCVLPNTVFAHCAHTTEEACEASGGGFHGCDSTCGILEQISCAEPADMCCCCWAGGDMCMPYWPQFGGGCGGTCYHPFSPQMCKDGPCCATLDEDTPLFLRSALLRCCEPGDNNSSPMPNCNGCIGDCLEDDMFGECFGVGGCTSCECEDMCGFTCVDGVCTEERCCGFWPSDCPGGFYCSDKCCMNHQQCCGEATSKCCHEISETCCKSEWFDGVGWEPTTCCEKPGMMFPYDDNPCNADMDPTTDIPDMIDCGCQNCHQQSGCDAWGGFWVGSSPTNGTCWCSPCHTVQGCIALGGAWVGSNNSQDPGFCDWGSCHTTGYEPCDADYLCVITDHNYCDTTTGVWTFKTNTTCRGCLIQPGETCCAHEWADGEPECCANEEILNEVLIDPGESCCLSLTGKEHECCPWYWDLDIPYDDWKNGCCPGFGEVSCCGWEERCDCAEPPNCHIVHEQCGTILGYNCIPPNICDGSGNPTVEQEPPWFGQCCTGWTKEWDCGGQTSDDPETDGNCQWTGNWMCCPTEMDCMMQDMDAVGYFTGADLCGCYYVSDNGGDCGTVEGGFWEIDGECINDGVGYCCNGTHLTRTTCCNGNWKLACHWMGNIDCDCGISTGHNDPYDLPDTGCCDGACIDTRAGGPNDGQYCCDGAIMCIDGEFYSGKGCCCKTDQVTGESYECVCCPVGDSQGLMDQKCCNNVCYDDVTQLCCGVWPDDLVIVDKTDFVCCDGAPGHICSTAGDSACCAAGCAADGGVGSVCCPQGCVPPGQVGCTQANCASQEGCGTDDWDGWGCWSPGIEEDLEERAYYSEPAVAPDNAGMDPSMPGYVPYYHSTEEPIKEKKISNTTKKQITKNSTEGISRYMVNGLCQEIYCEGNCEWPRC